MLEDLFVGADSPLKGQVDTFANLPATAELGELFAVKTTTGVIGVNRKIKGLYRWDGAAWVFADGIEANKVIYNNVDSSLTSGTVKAAIDELDTKRQDASNLTSGTLAEDRLPAIDADNTTINNLDVDNLKTGTLDTDLTAASPSDDTLASAKAIKAYVDANSPVNADWNATSGAAEILNKPTTITSAEQAKLGHISVTQTVDLDTMESDIATNNAKLNGIEAGATADQTQADINALGINADKVGGLQASQFLRSDAGDTVNVGRGAVYFEDNSDDNQNGAGVTIRTSANPTGGSEGSVGSIWAIRSSGGGLRLWVGQSETTTGINDFVTNDATFKGKVTLSPNEGYYVSNNANVFHGTNSANVTPTATDTSYYAIFNSTPVTNTAIYAYTAPTASSNTGIKLFQAGKYKVSYTLNWQNVSYNGRVNFFSSLVKHSSAITPTETEMAGSRSFGYARDDNYVPLATTTNVTVIDVVANEFIKCKTKVAKNSTTFNDNFSGLNYYLNSSIVIEFLGNI